MPRRARPGNRTAIEQALSDAQRTALAELCRDHGVPPDRWQNVASWCTTFTAAAAGNLVRRYRAEGQAEKAAEDRAASRLGIPAATLASWRDRAVRDAYRANMHNAA